METFHGRIIEQSPEKTRVRNAASEQVFSGLRGNFKLGDIVEISGGEARVLTPSQVTSQAWRSHVLDPRRLCGMQVRDQIESGIREFFRGRGFMETSTPLLVTSPGMETHIRPFPVISKYSHPTFLPSSPEFAMKKLLVGGLEKIFQICPAFRDEPHSITHSPEFTILEWYRAYAGYEEIMVDTETLFAALARKVFGQESIPYQGREISVRTPWPRLRVRDLFQEFADIDLVKNAKREELAQHCQRLGHDVRAEESWDDIYFKIWLNEIEPRLPTNRAVLVTRYPASQAALAVVDADPDGSRWARRFEVYAGGLELGNAFEELTDPVEQRARFVKDMDARREIYGAEFSLSPLDEEFIHALSEGMPPSGGIAIGVDRMIMLFADETDIDFTRWLPSGRPAFSK